MSSRSPCAVVWALKKPRLTNGLDAILLLRRHHQRIADGVAVLVDVDLDVRVLALVPVLEGLRHHAERAAEEDEHRHLDGVGAPDARRRAYRVDAERERAGGRAARGEDVAPRELLRARGVVVVAHSGRSFRVSTWTQLDDREAVAVCERAGHSSSIDGARRVPSRPEPDRRARRTRQRRSAATRRRRDRSRRRTR